MANSPSEFDMFNGSVQKICIGINGFGLNPHLLRSIWEETQDYDSAVDEVLRLEQEILNQIVEQEDRAHEARVAKL